MCCTGETSKMMGHGACCHVGEVRHHGHHHGFNRHFISNEERIEELEHYRDALEKELTGLNEHLNEMKK